ncbi:hypothetical protein HYPSUDRAFT_129424 [Hypholoma sublateritium FD-334 SS-4]|uniref:Ketoreductase (KR) domain-containing protein n=1 Tax=Hypholoma sublateritium (strain FD-334 SS-4) TaxID=945553 RepID=A0A0D2LKZ8_HYPSF|nr:hypothetical protein HYPSUDRAFT_129424 [Hypholoma sublateritium FD-334 SS-4]
MVLRIAEAFASKFFPTQYLIHIGVGILSLLVLRAFSQGRRTNRERDLHARIILVTGGFTPLGLTLLQSLAQRGAHIIALSPDPIESANVSILVDLLRSTTSNEEIYAEQCDLASPSSIRAFCTKFLTGKDQRLDAIIFAHEHRHIGSPKIFRAQQDEQDRNDRDANSLATFLMTTLLLPALLVAPVERDIRIINVVNPFYAAATALPFNPSFSVVDATTAWKNMSIISQEGRRSLRAIVLTRHLQRVLDALPSAAQVPKTEEGSRAVPVVSPKLQKSNIVAVSVSPGIGRVDTVSSILNADFLSPTGSYTGLTIYLLLQPLLRVFTKSPFSGMQTILHALFLPTPFKILQQTTVTSTKPKDKHPESAIDFSTLPMSGEMLLPGALYAECAAVKLNIKITPEMKEDDKKYREEAALKRKKDAAKADKGKGKATEESSLGEEVLDIPDDGEYGGELAGRLAWEGYEGALKVWEERNPGPVEEVTETLQPPVAPGPQSTPPTVEKENPDVY